MENYVKAYEKENRKIQVLFVIRFIPVFILYFFTALWSLPVGAILFIILFGLIFIYRKKAIVNNIIKINTILDENTDIELVLSIYEKLLMRKRRTDYAILLVSYLDKLLAAAKFEQFINVCNSNQRKLKNANIDDALTLICVPILALEKDKFEYRKYLQEEKKICTKIKVKNAKQGWLLRFNEVKYQYAIQEYEKALEIIEQLKPIGKYYVLAIESYRQRCLYHLKKEYRRPKETLYPFLTIQQWKHLVETGEELIVPESQEMLHLINQGIKGAKKRKKKALIVSMACIVFVVLWALFHAEEKMDGQVNTELTVEHYVTRLEKNGYDIKEINGMCQNEELIGSVIYASKPGDDPDVIYLPSYNIATIKHDQPNSQLKIKGIFFADETKIYTEKAKNSTYVVVITENQSQLSYDGVVIEDVVVAKLEEATFVNESYIHCFIHEGKFKESLLEIDSIDKIDSVEKNELGGFINTQIIEEYSDGFLILYWYDDNLSNVQAPTRYWFEKKVENEWKVIEMYEDEDTWKDYTYHFDKNIEKVIDVHWNWLLGYDLEPGEYRVGKNFTWYNNETHRTETKAIYVEFMLTAREE